MVNNCQLICMMSAAAWSRARGCCKVHTIPAGGGGSLWAPPAHTCAVTSEEEGGKIGGEASRKEGGIQDLVLKYAISIIPLHDREQGFYSP